MGRGRRVAESKLSGKVVVVTGAGSGIGRALAQELAARGATVAASDVDAEGLEGTAELVRNVGGTIRTDVLDVTQRERVAEYAADVVADLGRVNVVINNAGIAFTGDTLTETYKDVERVMDIDFWGVVHGTKEFLPHLIASGDGHVVNVSSVFGLVAVPSQGAYNAAKFAVRGFTEALSMEMRLSGHPVKVTCVHPGGIRTNIARNAGQVSGLDHDKLASSFDKVAKTSPSKAARTILDGVERGRPRVLIGPDARVIDLLARIAGPAYQGIVAKQASRGGL